MRRLLAAALLAACGCATGPAYRVAPELRASPGGTVALPPFVSRAAGEGAAGTMREVAAELLKKMGYEPVLTAGGAGGAALVCYGEVQDFTFENLGTGLRRSVRLSVRLVKADGGAVLYEGRGSGGGTKMYTGQAEARAAFAEQGGGREPAAALRREASDAAWEALGALPRPGR